MYYFKSSLGVLLLFTLSLFFLKSSKSQGCTPPPSGMAGWWTMDSTTVDHLGLNNTIQHGGIFSQGKVLHGYKSTSYNTYIEIPDNPNLNLADSFSIDAWIRIDSFNSDNMMIVWKGNPYGLNTSTSYSMVVLNQNHTYPGKLCIILGNGTAANFAISNTALPINQDIMVATVVNGNFIKIYINGVLDSTTPITISNYNSSHPLQIGGIKNLASHRTNYFNGIIDELELFNRALSATEIQAIYNAGSYGKCKSGCSTPVYSTDNQTACSSYTWIDGNTYSSNNTTATHTISGGAANGCDSIIQLNLTIQTVDSTVSRNGNTLNANQSGATYQWLTCKNGKYPITGATGQSFSPLTNGSYAVQISSGKCKATSDCLLFTKVSVDKITDRKFIVSAFPNPIDEVLYIKLNHGTWPSNQPIIAEIFDVTGKQIISKSIQSERTLVNTKTFKRGVYFIQVKVAHKAIYSGKIIK